MGTLLEGVALDAEIDGMSYWAVVQRATCDELVIEAIVIWLVSTFVFTLIYIILRWWLPHGASKVAALPLHEQVEWCSRIVSDIHAFPIVLATGSEITYNHVGYWDNKVVAVFEPQRSMSTYLAISAGYLTYDLLLCLRYRSTIGDPLTLLHHAVAVHGFLIAACSGLGQFYGQCFLFNELTTPLVNARWKMAVRKTSGGMRYILVIVMLLLGFFCVRIAFNIFVMSRIIGCWGEWYPIFAALKYPGASVDGKDLRQVVLSGLPTWRKNVLAYLTALCVLHVLVNVLWFGLILKAVARNVNKLLQGDTPMGESTFDPKPKAA